MAKFQVQKWRKFYVQKWRKISKSKNGEKILSPKMANIIFEKSEVQKWRIKFLKKVKSKNGEILFLKK